MDCATAQRHLANVERHIVEAGASVLRQQEIVRRLEGTGSRQSETASIPIGLSDLSSRFGPVRTRDIVEMRSTAGDLFSRQPE